MLITIGAFDGFHKGHAELLRLCRENSGNDGWGVVTFSPHPAEYLHGLHPLFTLKEREIIRRFLGIPNMYVLKFDDSLMNLSPAKFWHILRDMLNVDGLVMGRDFRFGHGREGSAESLAQLARSEGITKNTKIFIADLVDKKRYSSSTVRKSIMAGNVSVATEILGYPFFMIARVIHGYERGRTMHFPTANLELQEGRLIPAYGVYSAAVLVNGAWHCGALSIGNNPTFHDVTGTRAEIHILDFSGDVYGEEIMTLLLGRVRGIQKFPDRGTLIAQISRDIETCGKIYEDVMKRDEIQSFTSSTREQILHGINTPEIIKLT